MNIWLTKNIRFGYRYTTTKSMRGQINSCLYDWMDDLLTKRVKEGDILIIFGGLFSNTNPSLIAINDAHIFLKKISNKMTIYLVNSDKDVRLYEGEYYSALDIFSEINNISIIKDMNVLYSLFNIEENKFDVNQGKIGTINIPNLIQLEETEDKPGLIIYNPSSNKHVMIENSYSPKHVVIKINNIDDFTLINKDKIRNDLVHIELNNKLYEENKLEVSIALHGLNACSVKYVNTLEEIPIEKDILNITETLDIIDTIYTHIGDDENVKKQFERVLGVFKK